MAHAGRSGGAVPLPVVHPLNDSHAAVRFGGGPETHDPTAAHIWMEEIPYGDRLSHA